MDIHLFDVVFDSFQYLSPFFILCKVSFSPPVEEWTVGPWELTDAHRPMASFSSGPPALLSVSLSPLSSYRASSWNVYDPVDEHIAARSSICETHPPLVCFSGAIKVGSVSAGCFIEFWDGGRGEVQGLHGESPSDQDEKSQLQSSLLLSFFPSQDQKSFSTEPLSVSRTSSRPQRLLGNVASSVGAG